MERDLRAMFEAKEIEMAVPESLPPELRKRIGRQRMFLGASAAVAAAVLVIGGFSGALALTNDEALPPVNPDAEVFVDTWLSTDTDGSSQTMVVRPAPEDSLEIKVLDDSAGVCSGVSSTMIGTGSLDGTDTLVIPSPEYTCDDGSIPETESGPPLEEQLRNLTFVHDPESDTLTDNIGVTWGRDGAPEGDCQPPTDPEAMPSPECLRGEQLPGTQVASGSYRGTPWSLNVFTEPVIGEDHAEGYHSLGIKGSLGDETFAWVSGIRPDSELEGTVGDKLFTFRDGLPDVLVISGTTTPDITRVEFSEAGRTVEAETIEVPSEMGDDFRVYVLFAPFGTEVGCLRWDIPTVNCFGAVQRVTAFDASGEVVAERLLQPDLGRDCLFCSQGPADPDEFVTQGIQGGLKWRLSARRYEHSHERCFAFSLGPKEAGGAGCITHPGSDWFGEAGQRVEPDRPEVAPVYGAIPSHVDAVEVALVDGSTIGARIYRPENHALAYYLAWIPDAYATGSVRFISEGSELGSLPLCAVDHTTRARGFVCYGTDREQ